MRVAELSERTGVPVATIKYYLREGLVPRGELTSPNQARYDERHERRIRLVRALVEVGGLSIATTRELVAHLDSPGTDLDEVLGRAMRTVAPEQVPIEEEHRKAAVTAVDELIERRGWRVDLDYPARQSLVDAVATLRRFGGDSVLANIDRYADAADQIADVDLEQVSRLSNVDAAVELAVVGTIVGDTLIAALRRVAQASASARRFAGGSRRSSDGVRAEPPG